MSEKQLSVEEILNEARDAWEEIHSHVDFDMIPTQPKAWIDGWIFAVRWMEARGEK